MKKIVSILTVLALVCLCAVPAFAVNTTAALTLSADKTTANAGDIITVTVSVSENSNLGTLQFNVEFDKTAYTPVENSETTPIAALTPAVNLDYATGVRYAGATAGAITEGGALLTFQLRVVKPGSALSLNIGLASDGTTLDGEDVTDQVIANSKTTSVTIACGHATQLSEITKYPTCT